MPTTVTLEDRIIRARSEQLKAVWADQTSAAGYWERVVNRLLEELHERTTAAA